MLGSFMRKEAERMADMTPHAHTILAWFEPHARTHARTHTRTHARTLRDHTPPQGRAERPAGLPMSRETQNGPFTPAIHKLLGSSTEVHSGWPSGASPGSTAASSAPNVAS
eukprot:5069902-Amphidinium_carterae.1